MAFLGGRRFQPHLSSGNHLCPEQAIGGLLSLNRGTVYFHPDSRGLGVDGTYLPKVPNYRKVPWITSSVSHFNSTCGAADSPFYSALRELSPKLVRYLGT